MSDSAPETPETPETPAADAAPVAAEPKVKLAWLHRTGAPVNVQKKRAELAAGRSRRQQTNLQDLAADLRAQAEEAAQAADAAGARAAGFEGEVADYKSRLAEADRITKETADRKQAEREAHDARVAELNTQRSEAEQAKSAEIETADQAVEAARAALRAAEAEAAARRQEFGEIGSQHQTAVGQSRRTLQDNIRNIDAAAVNARTRALVTKAAPAASGAGELGQ